MLLMSSSMKTEPFIMLLGEKGSQGRDKEASQTRDYRVAKCGTHRAARPNPSQHKVCVARETAGVGRREQSNRNAGIRCFVPVQELPECGAAMAVLSFFFWGQFGEGFLNRGEVK